VSAALAEPSTEGEPGARSAAAELAAHSRTVALGTLVSRVTGFGRVAALAAVLGPTYFGNLFQTSLLLPYILCQLLMTSLTTAILTPHLVRHLDAGDHAGARPVANGFLGVACILFTVVAVLCAAGAPIFVILLTSAVPDPEVREHQLRLGAPLIMALAPQVLFYGITAISIAVQQAHRRFALPSAAPAIENIAVIAVLGATALLFGVGSDVDAISTGQLLLLGLGSTAAVALHTAVQWLGAWRAGVSLVPSAGWRDPEVRRVVRLALPSSGNATLTAAAVLAILIVAGSVPGGAVAFQIAYNLFNLPIALAARPVAAAQLPLLARSFQRNAAAAAHAIYRDSLRLTLFVAMPASLLFLCVPETLARAIAFGEMRTHEGIALVAAAIAGLGIGLIGDAVLALSTSASYARHDATGPLKAVAIRMAVACAGTALASRTMHGAGLLLALGLSLSIANLCAAAYLHGEQLRFLPRLSSPWKRSLLGDLGASILAGAGAILLAHSMAGQTGSSARSLGAAALVVGFSAVLYLLSQLARGSGELRTLFGGFLPGTPKPTPPAGIGPPA
jgi:putative peptidoglycan lipid II flippase